MKPLFANGLALLAAVSWGIGGVPQKTVLAHLDAFTVTGVTCLLGAFVILPLAWREHARAAGRGRPSLAGIAAVALPFSAGVTLTQLGYGLTTVANAGFFSNTAAVITPFVAWALLRHRPGAWMIPACALTALGLLLMAGGGLAAPVAGDFICLAAALAFSLWLVLMGTHVARHRNPGAITFAQLLFCGTGCLAIGLITHGLPARDQLLAALPELLIIGVVSKGLAYCLSAASQQYIHPSVAAVLVSAEAVFGALLASVLISETLGTWQWVGALAVTAGIILVSLRQSSIGATGQRAS